MNSIVVQVTCSLAMLLSGCTRVTIEGSNNTVSDTGGHGGVVLAPQPFCSRWIYLPKACAVVAELLGPDGEKQTAQTYPLGPDASWHALRIRRLMAVTTGDVYIAD
jgi:hypothetical protein